MVDNVVINDKFALDLRMWPEFQTTVVKLAGGYEDRNQDWPQALWRYEVGLNNRDLSEIREFVTFLIGRRGAARAFLLRDPLYNSLTDENIGTGDGSTTQFQARQVFADTANPYSRYWYTINDLVVKKNGVTQTITTHYTVSNGLITFVSAPTAGHAITISGSPLVRVRFADDVVPVNLPISPDFANAFASVPSFRLEEVPA